MIFELLILGSTSAVPSHGRYLSSQLLNVHEKLYLIDCGEATQFRLQQLRVSHHKIDHIFISHLHGDHILGLPGLINSMNLIGRAKKLDIFCPSGLDQIIDKVFEISHSFINFEICYHYINTSNYTKIFKNNSIEVFAFPLHHSIDTFGFRFNERIDYHNINPEAITRYGLNIEQIKAARSGSDIELENGVLLSNSDIVLPQRKKRSYAYCSDTRYFPGLANHVRDVDLLYHESTYLDDMKDKASERFHSTSVQAASIAKKANAGKLLLGHFSSRYTDLNPFLFEAKQHFDNVELAIDGAIFSIDKNHEEDVSR